MNTIKKTANSKFPFLINPKILISIINAKITPIPPKLHPLNMGYTSVTLKIQWKGMGVKLWKIIW